jgi:chromosome segregation ATPase
MTIQEIISKEAETLNTAYDLHKDWKSALKDLKKELSSQLKWNPDWIELDERSKVLKVNRKDMSEQIKEADKAKDQIDKSLNNLSRELAEKWIIWEVEYKNWKLSLIIAKH